MIVPEFCNESPEGSVPKRLIVPVLLPPRRAAPETFIVPELLIAVPPTVLVDVPPPMFNVPALSKGTDDQPVAGA